jgi:hypothetical protein
VQPHPGEAVQLVATDELPVAGRRQLHRRVAVPPAPVEQHVGRATVPEPGVAHFGQGLEQWNTASRNLSLTDYYDKQGALPWLVGPYPEPKVLPPSHDGNSALRSHPPLSPTLYEAASAPRSTTLRGRSGLAAPRRRELEPWRTAQEPMMRGKKPG